VKLVAECTGQPACTWTTTWNFTCGNEQAHVPRCRWIRLASRKQCRRPYLHAAQKPGIFPGSGAVWPGSLSGTEL